MHSWIKAVSGAIVAQRGPGRSAATVCIPDYSTTQFHYGFKSFQMCWSPDLKCRYGKEKRQEILVVQTLRLTESHQVVWGINTMHNTFHRVTFLIIPCSFLLSKALLHLQAEAMQWNNILQSNRNRSLPACLRWIYPLWTGDMAVHEPLSPESLYNDWCNQWCDFNTRLLEFPTIANLDNRWSYTDF